MNISIDGLSSAMQRFQTAAGKVSRAASACQPGDSVDLSAEMVSMLSARNEYQANIKVVHAQNEIAKSTLDILA